MGYYRTSTYRGDYYRGDYYRGDPGIFDDILGVAGSVLPAVLPALGAAAGSIIPGLGTVVGGGIGTALGGLIRSVTRPSPEAATVPGSTSGPAMIPSTGGYAPTPGLPMLPSRGRGAVTLVHQGPAAPQVAFTGGGGGGSGGAGAGRDDGGAAASSETTRRSPRMNALNPKALKRALRRAGTFEKFARKTLRIVRPGMQVAGFKRGLFGKSKRRRACA